MMQGRSLVRTAALAAVMAALAPAQYALFDSATDTISVPGETVLSTAFTAEARVRLSTTIPAPPTNALLIFQEQYDDQEDKALAAGPVGIGGTAWRMTGDPPFLVGGALCPGVWYHVAHVYDGAEQRLYLDGNLVSSRPFAGTLANWSGSAMSIGAFQEPAGAMVFRASFIGYIDTVRVSNVVRYTGSSFTPPTGDLGADAATLLLYNFNDAPGSPTAADSSGSGWTGTLGTGFSGATSPTFTGVVDAAPVTTGVVGVNDLTLNGMGSGAASCAPILLPPGAGVLTASITAAPGSVVILAASERCCPSAITVTPGPPPYSIDIELSSLTFVADGTGTVIPPNFLTQFGTVTPAGYWLLATSANLMPGAEVSLQGVLIGPTFPTGIGPTQALDVDVSTSIPIPLSDDGSAMVTFTPGFPFYGVTYTTLFLNANGNITFGTFDPDFTASPAEMLAGPPRIAPAWNDWNPGAGGTVSIAGTASSVVASWVAVPRFGCADSNTFSVDLALASGVITFSYGAMALCGGIQGELAGISPGGSLSAAAPVDLTAPPNASGSATGALYELYAAPPFFDLGPTWGGPASLTFTPAGAGAGPYVQM